MNKIAFITLSSEGALVLAKIGRVFPNAKLFVHKSAECQLDAGRFESVKALTGEIMDEYDGLVYVAPCGAVVRALEGNIRSKREDPAVVVMDVGARYAISLLSGHEGGANGLAVAIANVTGAEPVITTTTEASRKHIVGVGCKRGKKAEEIVDAIEMALEEAAVPTRSVRYIASADIKSGEAGLVEAAGNLNIPIRFIASDEIRSSTREFARSSFVREKVNLPAVAEPAALLAGHRTELVLGKRKYNGITVAVARETPLFEKSDSANMVEDKAKPANRDKGRGKLFVVGIGPGGPLDRTRRAEMAIERSTVVAGYTRYLELVEDMSAGKRIISSGMTKEINRCRAALLKARDGETVSLISSGDAGVYGMAGLAIELAQAEGIDVEIEVVPGVSAANAAASRLGAPLSLDFATISLSDLLVPWEMIRNRLEAAAAADMVVALYNPKSRKRITQLDEAAAIFRKHRPGDTPVGVCDSIGLAEEKITITDLARFLDENIGMRSTLIIGSSGSRVIDGKIVTARGYMI